MIEKLIKYKKYIISIALMLLLSILFINMKYLLPKKHEKLSEVKLVNDIEKSKALAIMISNDGSDYQEYDSETFPGDEYKFKEAKCVDNNGNLVENIITYNEKEKQVTLETDKTVSCTLYFIHKENIEILRENDPQNILTKTIVGDMYRYQGTDNVPNWICFGTSENCGVNDNLIDKYMYRIIGIDTTGQMKLIKETFVKEGDNAVFSWGNIYNYDSPYGVKCLDGKCPDWSGTLIYKRLNGISNGSRSGTGSYDTGGDTNIFINSASYDYLSPNSKWNNLILNHSWLYGEISDDSTGIVFKFDGNAIYRIEAGIDSTVHRIISSGSVVTENYKWTKRVTAKIGLMYLHDYYLAYYDETNDNSRGNPTNQTNAMKSWIFFQKDGYNKSYTYEWLMTANGAFTVYDPITVWYLNSGGGFSYYGSQDYNIKGVRPTFYITSDVKISGHGLKEDPFIINMK